MTSKNLFFKLLWERTKQSLWLIALAGLVSFFAFPVVAAVMAGWYLDTERLAGLARASEGMMTVEMCRDIASRQLAGEFYNLISPGGPLLVCLIPAAAVLCGLAGFSYLNSRKKTDFYHSLPVRRELLFWVSYVGGILYAAVPYLTALLIAGGLVQMQMMPVSLDWGILFASFGQGLAFFVLSYSVTVLASVLTGNLVVSVLGTAVFFFLGPVTVFIIRSYYSAFFSSYYQAEGWLNWISYDKVSPIMFQIGAFAQEEAAGARALAALAAGAAIMLAALFLYRKRPSEAAGRAMAFRNSQPVIKVLLMVPSALGAGLFFYFVRNEASWAVFGLVCGLLISGCVIEIIYHFDFKKAFSGWKSSAAGTTAAVFIFCMFWFDLGGYDSYIPRPDQVVSVGVSSYYLYSDLRGDRTELRVGEDGGLRETVPSNYDILKEMAISDPEAVETVLEIAREGIAGLDAEKNASEQAIEYSEREEAELTDSAANEAEEPVSPQDETADILIQYHLKNGNTITRSYQVDFLRIKDTVDKLYENREFKRESYPVLKLETDEIAGANFQVFGEYSHINLETDKLPELLAAYQEEFYTLTLDEKREEAPLGYIQFKTRDMQETIDTLRMEKRDYTRFNNFAYYPVYPQFKRTAEILRTSGTELADCIVPADVERIVLQGIYDEEGDFDPVLEPGLKLYRENGRRYLEVEDTDRIRQILESAKEGSDPLFWMRRESSLDISVYLTPEASERFSFDGGSGCITGFTFRKGNVPEFVREMLER